MLRVVNCILAPAPARSARVGFGTWRLSVGSKSLSDLSGWALLPNARSSLGRLGRLSLRVNELGFLASVR